MPGRALLVAAFVAIVVTAGLGGAIGWSLVDTSCSEEPTVAEQLLDDVPGFERTAQSCDAKLLLGAIAGTVIAGVGAGIVAGMLLRAQSEWRAHPPGRAAAADPEARVTPAGSGGTPPRT